MLSTFHYPKQPETNDWFPKLTTYSCNHVRNHHYKYHGKEPFIYGCFHKLVPPGPFSTKFLDAAPLNTVVLMGSPFSECECKAVVIAAKAFQTIYIVAMCLRRSVLYGVHLFTGYHVIFNSGDTSLVFTLSPCSLTRHAVLTWS